MSIDSTSKLPAAGTISSSLDAEDRAQVAVIHRAVEVIGDHHNAMQWLGTPVRALNYATPISLLYEAKGREDVLNVLGCIEHGVTA
jgi:putative toxin-antitoxin system antitoxin component (TIGR02293 family)